MSGGGATARYLVGTWTFTDPDRAQDTPCYLLDATGDARRLPGAATAVYYGAAEPDGQGLLLLHNDLHRSALSRQVLDEAGCLVEAGRWSSGGGGGSYIAFDRNGRFFAVANARTGCTVFRNGAVPAVIAHLTNTGSGPHPRQRHSHPHCVLFSPDNRWLYAADMGTDEVLVFAFDAHTGAAGPRRTAYRAPPGSGPRHILFHRGRGYLLSELGNTLVVLEPAADGSLEPLQTVGTLPAGFDGFSHTAHLAVGPGGDTLLASNRGHNSIVVFALGQDGLVTGSRWSSSGGEWPWFFLVTDDGRLLVANTLSDRLTWLAPAPDGDWEPVGHIAIPRPAFILRG